MAGLEEGRHYDPLDRFVIQFIFSSSLSHLAGLFLIYSRILFNDLSFLIIWSWNDRCQVKSDNPFWWINLDDVVLNAPTKDDNDLILCRDRSWPVRIELFIIKIPWIWLGMRTVLFDYLYKSLHNNNLIVNNCILLNDSVIFGLIFLALYLLYRTGHDLSLHILFVFNFSWYNN